MNTLIEPIKVKYYERLYMIGEVGEKDGSEDDHDMDLGRDMEGTHPPKGDWRIYGRCSPEVAKGGEKRMSNSEWIHYKDRDQELMIRFEPGAVTLYDGDRWIGVMNHVILEKRGKIAHEVNKTFWRAHLKKKFIKHPILFNRWFIEKLEERPEWERMAKSWKEEAVEKKRLELKMKRLETEMENRPPIVALEEQRERVREIREKYLAQPQLRKELADKLSKYIPAQKELLSLLESIYNDYFINREKRTKWDWRRGKDVEKEYVIPTDLGTGRWWLASEAIQCVGTSILKLEELVSLLRGEPDIGKKLLDAYGVVEGKVSE